jgi:hypothetical protein
MNFKEKADELFKKILESKIEKAKLDPVGQEDDDVDNDGDVDDSDEYLHNRRKAIAKAMKKEEAESVEEAVRVKDDLGTHPTMKSNHPHSAERRAAAAAIVRDYRNNPKNRKQGRIDYGSNFTRQTGFKVRKEEIEEIDEISKATKLSYYTKATTGKRRPQDYQKQSNADAKRMKDDPTNPAWKKRKDYWDNKAAKRQQGIDRAKAALTKEEVEK